MDFSVLYLKFLISMAYNVLLAEKIISLWSQDFQLEGHISA